MIASLPRLLLTRDPFLIYSHSQECSQAVYASRCCRFRSQAIIGRKGITIAITPRQGINPQEMHLVDHIESDLHSICPSPSPWQTISKVITFQTGVRLRFHAPWHRSTTDVILHYKVKPFDKQERFYLNTVLPMRISTLTLTISTLQGS